MKMNDMKMNANSDRRINKIIKIKSVKLTYFGLYSNSKRYRNCHVENNEASLSASGSQRAEAVEIRRRRVARVLIPAGFLQRFHFLENFKKFPFQGNFDSKISLWIFKEESLNNQSKAVEPDSARFQVLKSPSTRKAGWLFPIV
jgi:hypothetical protein